VTAHWVVNWVVKNERKGLVNVVPLKTPDTTNVTLTIELPTETAALINKFVALDQQAQNTPDVVVRMWPRPPRTIPLGKAATRRLLVLSEHGYRT
jgi:hypothetical protein